jgi:sulfur-oxidizing protein SoxY
MINRRQVLSHSGRVSTLLATSGLLWSPLAARAAGPFDSRNLTEAVKSLGGSAPVESRDVLLSAPDISENGAQVQVGVSTALPGVRRLLLLVEKNPTALSAVFELSDAVEPNVTTRVKMGQSSNVYAVAMMADGRVLFARKDVKVTLGGCAG